MPGKIGHCEGEDAEDGKGDGEPEEPWAVLSPAAIGLVEEDPPNGSVDGVGDARDEHEPAGGGGGDAVDVGVELQEEDADGVEDELAGDVGEGVADAGLSTRRDAQARRVIVEDIRGSLGRRQGGELSGDEIAEVVAVEDVGDFYGFFSGVGVLHGLHEGHGDEAFVHVGACLLVGFDTAGGVCQP